MRFPEPSARFLGAVLPLLGSALASGCGGAEAELRTSAALPPPAASPARLESVAEASTKAPPAAELLEPASPEPASPEPASPEPALPEPASPELPPIPTGTVVLHIGDSFLAAGLAQALRPKLTELGARYEARSEQSSYTTTWASKVERLVANTQPHLVLITLGANEVANTDPKTHAHAVRRIAKVVGTRPCVWITPPLWRKDTGIIAVIREHSAPCRFFESDALVPGPIPRQADKIHPSREGGAIWAEAFWAWLQKERTTPPPGGSPWALRPGPAAEHAPSP